MYDNPGLNICTFQYFLSLLHIKEALSRKSHIIEIPILLYCTLSGLHWMDFSFLL